jgi:hypothetical protein
VAKCTILASVRSDLYNNFRGSHIFNFVAPITALHTNRSALWKPSGLFVLSIVRSCQSDKNAIVTSVQAELYNDLRGWCFFEFSSSNRSAYGLFRTLTGCAFQKTTWGVVRVTKTLLWLPFRHICFTFSDDDFFEFRSSDPNTFGLFGMPTRFMVATGRGRGSDPLPLPVP